MLYYFTIFNYHVLDFKATHLQTNDRVSCEPCGLGDWRANAMAGILWRLSFRHFARTHRCHDKLTILFVCLNNIKDQELIIKEQTRSKATSLSNLKMIKALNGHIMYPLNNQGPLSHIPRFHLRWGYETKNVKNRKQLKLKWNENSTLVATEFKKKPARLETF